MKPAIIDSPLSQNFGSEASRPKGVEGGQPAISLAL
jgi:hypothetical protein